MKKLILPVLILITFLLTACLQDPSPRYVPERVVAYLYGNSGLDEILEYVYAIDGLSIQGSHGIRYITDLPEDSTDALRTAMRKKDYFWYYTTTAGYFEGVLRGAVNFNDMSEEDKDDCLAFFEKYHMQRDTTDTFLNSLYLKVPSGLELYWVELLSHDDFFWNVEVDWYGSFDERCVNESK